MKEMLKNVNKKPLACLASASSQGIITRQSRQGAHSDRRRGRSTKGPD